MRKYNLCRISLIAIPPVLFWLIGLLVGVFSIAPLGEALKGFVGSALAWVGLLGGLSSALGRPLLQTCERSSPRDSRLYIPQAIKEQRERFQRKRLIWIIGSAATFIAGVALLVTLLVPEEPGQEPVVDETPKEGLAHADGAPPVVSLTPSPDPFQSSTLGPDLTTPLAGAEPSDSPSVDQSYSENEKSPLDISLKLSIEWPKEEWAPAAATKWERPINGSYGSFASLDSRRIGASSPGGRLGLSESHETTEQKSDDFQMIGSQITAIHFTSGDRFLITASLDSLVRKWVLEGFTKLQSDTQVSVGGRILAMDVDDDCCIALGLDTGELVILSISSLAILDRQQLVHGDQAPIWDLAYSLDGSILVTVGGNNFAYYHGIGSSGAREEPGMRASSWRIPSPVGYVTAVAALPGPNADEFLIGTPDGRVYRFSPNSKEPLAQSPSLEAPIWKIAVSNDGSIIAAGTSTGHVLFLQAPGLEEYEESIFIAEGFAADQVSPFITDLMFGSDGKDLLVGHAKGVSIFAIAEE